MGGAGRQKAEEKSLPRGSSRRRSASETDSSVPAPSISYAFAFEMTSASGVLGPTGALGVAEGAGVDGCWMEVLRLMNGMFMEGSRRLDAGFGSGRGSQSGMSP